jgi:hypothetical protein
VLCSKCQGTNKTFVAMLGTALPAKATNSLADPFFLKTGSGTPGAYAARNLCKDVLATEAVEGLDLLEMRASKQVD